MSYPALIAAKAKWDRGVEEIKTVDRESRRIEKGEPFRIEVEFERETGWHVAYVRMRKEPSPDLSVLVGSAAYQFLSALNLIVWELASRKVGRRKVKQVKNDIAFPIASKPADFESLRLRRYVSKQAFAYLRRVQPYNRLHGPKGPHQHSLFVIKEMADSDKHRVLAAVFGQMDASGITFKWDESVARNPTVVRDAIPRHRVVIDGAPLARIRFGIGNDKVKVGVNRQPAAKVAFNSDNWLIERSALAECVVGTAWTIRSLTPLFAGQPNPWGPPPSGPEVQVSALGASTEKDQV